MLTRLEAQICSNLYIILVLLTNMKSVFSGISLEQLEFYYSFQSCDWDRIGYCLLEGSNSLFRYLKNIDL